MLVIQLLKNKKNMFAILVIIWAVVTLIEDVTNGRAD